MPLPKQPRRIPNNKPKKPHPQNPSSHPSKAAPTPTAPPERRPKSSEIIEAVKSASQLLDEIAEEELQERQKAFANSQRRVTGGSLDWKQYLRPKNQTDVDECRLIDAYNNDVYEHNNSMAPQINELLKKLGYPTKNVEAPQKYTAIALNKREEVLWNPEFRIIAGVEWLGNRDVFPVRDYEVAEAPSVADAKAQAEEIARLVEAADDEGIDITRAVGLGHQDNCTCDNRWDGTSERCIGNGVRLRWRRQKNHHFLRPAIVPETF